MYIYIKMVTG